MKSNKVGLSPEACLNAQLDIMKQKLMEALGMVEHICTTADTWSAYY